MGNYYEALLWAPFIVAMFFWGRGLLRGSRSDVGLALCVLLVSAFMAVAVVGDSSVVNLIGGGLLLFGIVALLLRNDAAEKKTMSKQGVIMIAVLFIVIGILGCMIL